MNNCKLILLIKIYLCRFPFVLGYEEKISLRNLQDNIGIIPIKLGTAKIKEYSHTLILFYDLNLLIDEVNRLHDQTINISNIILVNKYYYSETFNYLQILNVTMTKTETKLLEIIPHPKRIKRGLINGIGSIFKAITGNLDAADGERYEHLINQLQNNQNKLGKNVLKENSLCLDIIKNFNKTIVKILHNEQTLKSKILLIDKAMNQQLNRETAFVIKDTLNQLINSFEIFNSILQDIENSITFAKINVMHPSIITIKDLYKQVLKLKGDIKSSQLPFEINLENILLLEKLIKVEGFILNNKITYLLHIPIMYSDVFNYYHIYSVPIPDKNQFKMVIPKSKYLLENKLHYQHTNDICIKINPQKYICEIDEVPMKENYENSSCEMQILLTTRSTVCQQSVVKISRSVVQQLDITNQFIGVFVNTSVINLKCNVQDETVKLYGTYLINIPKNCILTFNNESIVNKQKTINVNNYPVLLFESNNVINNNHVMDNLTINLEDIKFDEINKISKQINKDILYLEKVEYFKSISIWSVISYLFILIIIIFLLYKNLYLKKFKNKQQIKNSNNEIEMNEIQLSL